MRKNVLPFQQAICYSGFREGQSPDMGIFPSYHEIREDLHILQKQWKYLRLYDCDGHAEMAMDIIKMDKLDLKVLLGAYIGAEISNPNCPWGGVYEPETLAANKASNEARINRLIELANEYPEVVAALSVGNEATVDWTDHLVSEESVIKYARLVRQNATQPVTFCENYVPWLDKLEKLAEEVDFISIHTYPVWEYKSIDEAIAYTNENYQAVAQKYPDKQVVITEAGWTTNSNGRGILPENADEDLQARYYQELCDWSTKEGVVTFVFEAFDESWKGSPEPLEPEKHWGLFDIDRKPKKVMKLLFAELT